MSTTVDADIATAWHALHDHLEVIDGLLPDSVQDGGTIGISLIDCVGQISFQASRVISQRIGLDKRDIAWNTEVGRTQVHRHVLEGTTGDTTTAGASWQAQGRQATTVQHNVLSLLDLRTITTHRRIRPIKDRGGFKTCDSGLSPVPVRLSTSISAFLPECLLVKPGEPSVPSKKGTSVVDGQTLADMCRDPIIKARFGTRCEVCASMRCLVLEADDSVGICFTLCVGESTPEVPVSRDHFHIVPNDILPLPPDGKVLRGAIGASRALSCIRLQHLLRNFLSLDKYGIDVNVGVVTRSNCCAVD